MKIKFLYLVVYFITAIFFFVNSSFSLDIVATYDTPGYAYNISELYQDKDYVLADSIGVVIFNENGLGPRVNTAGCAYEPRIIFPPQWYDPVLIVADGDNGLSVFLSDTGSSWIDSFVLDVGGKATCIEKFENKYIFVGTGKGLVVFDFSDPENYKQIFSDTLWCKNVEDIVIGDDFAYVLAGFGYILVKVNIKNMNNVKIEHIVEVSGDTSGVDTPIVDISGVDILNDTAYIAKNCVFSIYSTLIDSNDVVIDSNGVKFVYKGHFVDILLHYHAEDIKIFDHYAYISMSKSVAGTFNGVMVYDISNRTSPVLVDSCITPGKANGLFVNKDYVFLADGDAGVVVLGNSVPISNESIQPSDLQEIRRAGLLKIAPNKTSLHIVYTVRNSCNVTLNIVSLKGKVIRGLFKGMKNSGKFPCSWDFRDNRGNIVPAGIYYINLRMNGLCITRSFVKLK